MNPSSSRRRLATLVLCMAIDASLAVGADPVRAAATDAATEAATWTARAATATDASVVLMPDMAYFRMPLNEAQLQQHGCRHAIADGDAVRSLVALFADAKPAVDPVYRPVDMREAIYLTLADGSRLNVFVEDNHGGRTPVVGIVETSGGGSLRSVPALFAASFAADLRTWTSRHGGDGDGPGCRRPVAEPQ